MSVGNFLARRRRRHLLLALLLPICAGAAAAPATPTPSEAPSLPLGTPPPRAVYPRPEFVFEFRVSLAPAVVLGETAYGHRQYIPIMGGKIAGPKLTGEVIPGGWDYQLGLKDGCTQLAADYFIRAEDGTVIHVLDEGMVCQPKGAQAPRNFYRPRFEAPKGAYEWLNHAQFVVATELEPAGPSAASGTPAPQSALRLKFYQLQ